MDYSQYQVKYIDTLLPEWKAPNISQDSSFSDLQDTPDYSRISYQNGEAEPPTALIRQEAIPQPSNPVRRALSAPTFKPSRGLAQFNKDFDEALKIGGDEAKQLQSRRAVLTHLAQIESTFNSMAKNKKAPAYGYFQFMQGMYNGTNHNNIGRHAKVDVNTFMKSPVLQIRAANSLANEFFASIGKANIEKLHKLGWTDNAILAGAWLGGPGNVIRYATRGIDASDGTDSVGKRMKKFNY